MSVGWARQQMLTIKADLNREWNVRSISGLVEKVGPTVARALVWKRLAQLVMAQAMEEYEPAQAMMREVWLEFDSQFE